MSRQEAGKCPECGEMVEVDSDVEVGDAIFCPGCDCELTVLRLHPPKFSVLESSTSDEDDEDELGEGSEWLSEEDNDGSGEDKY